MARRKSKKTPEPELKPPPPPPPLDPKPSTKFKQDIERLKERGKDAAKLRTIIEALCQHRPLEPKHRDHALTDDWRGWRDGHVEPDWVLIDRRDGGTLILGRSGTHSDLGLESSPGSLLLRYGPGFRRRYPCPVKPENGT